MPISAADLAEIQKVSLNKYIKGKAEDQIATNKPFLKKMMSGKKQFGGAAQGVVIPVIKDYGSNAKFTRGEATVDFNKRNVSENAQFNWSVMVDGLYLDWDRLFANGIEVVENRASGSQTRSRSEEVQIINLLAEQMSALKNGFMASLDIALHRNGSQDADAFPGLDALVALNPLVGTVGGFDRSLATNDYWRNYAKTGIATSQTGTLDVEMANAWRACIKKSETESPNFIMAGSDFIEAFRKEFTVVNNADAKKTKVIDGGTGDGVNTGLLYKGVEVLWNPTFDKLDDIENPPVKWKKRCYFLNTNHLHLYTAGINTIDPVRPHNVRALYSMIEMRLFMASNKLNSQAVLAIS